MGNLNIKNRLNFFNKSIIIDYSNNLISTYDLLKNIKKV